MSGLIMGRVVWVGGREGAWWLPAVGIRASKALFLVNRCFPVDSFYAGKNVYVQCHKNATVGT